MCRDKNVLSPAKSKKVIVSFVFFAVAHVQKMHAYFWL